VTSSDWRSIPTLAAAHALVSFKGKRVAKRYSMHRNYRLPGDLVVEIGKVAEYNQISESEATRRLLCAMVRRMNDMGTRNLSAEELRDARTDKEQ